MKKTIIALSLVLCMLNGYSQVKKEKAQKPVNVPAMVKKAFTAQYPNVIKVNWSIEKPGEYEAEFNQNKTVVSALYDTKGTLLETESKITESELPQAIKSVLAKEYAAYKIGGVEKNVAKGKVTYEVDATKAKKESELIFNANGKLVKQAAEKQD